MSEPKTAPNDASVGEFLAAVEPAAKRADAHELLSLFERVTGEPARMWGPSIIGFGEYTMTYANGRTAPWMRAGFSPRKAKHSLYLMGGYCDAAAGQAREAALARLGKHSTGKSCLYINKLADIDMAVLEEMIAADWEAMQRLYPS
ncbi:MAG: DUF1801 domain-containing protein [Erythrobacter sp.]|jgi:hypothetical protein|nr:DUF1801 domain-containing protein [Erythrobacter sp.]